MKPVKQVVRDAGKGDCWRACIASIFELSIEGAPNFWEQTQDASEFWELNRNWLAKELNMSLVIMRYCEEAIEVLRGVLCIAIGTSPRKKTRGHAIVWRDGAVHDPHPDNRNLVGDPYELAVFIPFDPIGGEKMNKDDKLLKELKRLTGALACLCECLGMEAENRQVEQRGETLPYGIEQFMALLKEYGMSEGKKNESN